MNTTNTEWKTLIIPSYCIEDYTEKCYLLHMPTGYSSNTNSRHFIYISKKLVRFIGNKQCRVSYLPHMTWLAKGCVNREMTAVELESIFAEYEERRKLWDAE